MRDLNGPFSWSFAGARNELRVIRLFAGLFLLLIAAGCGNGLQSKKTATVHTQNGSYHFHLEIADEPSERAQGLMNRTDLGDKAGMLFVWTENTQGSFWMKNTLISLDILFIDKDLNIVHVAPRTEPLSEDPISSASPYRYVLEVKSGFVNRSGVRAGDRVQLQL